MAKQAVGPVIRHLDKAVLGLCAAGFLYVVAMYGVMSPNKVGAEGAEQMGPAELDRRVEVAANTLIDRLRNAEPPDEEIQDPKLPPPPLELAGVSPTLPRPVPFNIPVPDVLGEIGTPLDTRKLVEVLAPDKPLIMGGRSGAYLIPPDSFESKSASNRRDEIFLQDVNWVTVSAPFHRAEQEKLARQAGYDVTRIETIFLGMDVERRVRLADGSYADWVPLTPTAGVARPIYPEPKVYAVDRGFNVSDPDRAQVESFYDMIKADDNQLTLIRPLFPEIEYGDPWLYPRAEGMDVLEMDAEYQDPPTCRYPECSAGGFGIDTSASAKDLLKQAEAALVEGNFDRAEGLASEAKSRATRDRDKEDADDLLDRIATQKAAAPAKGPAPRQDVQVLWAHDAGADSLESGRTYQYRCRVRIFNRYCGNPTLLREPTDAEKVELVGAWSEPSEPITIKPDTYVFLKSGREDRQECKVEVYKWVEGEWLMKSFDVTVGDRIAKEGRVETPRSVEQKVDVNFDARATVVDMDFRRPYRSRDRNGRLERPTNTTALVYVDSAGTLHECLLDFDKGSDVYKAIKSSYWKPPRQ